MKLYYLLLGVCLLHTTLWSQEPPKNWVLNPSLEASTPCDGEGVGIEKTAHWVRLAGKPGLLNLACPLSKDTRTYVQGVQLPPAYVGDVYATIGLDIEGEYWQASLRNPLDSGQRYWVRLFVRLPSRYCSTPVKSLGAHFSVDSLASTTEYIQLDKPSIALEVSAEESISATHRWQEISGFYDAKGGERFIALGNFKDQNKGLFEQREDKECTLLFFDQLIVEAYVPPTLEKFKASSTLTANARFLLDIKFMPGLAQLTAADQNLLDILSEKLLAQENISLVINAHTDNRAEEYINAQFSKSKAEAIQAYLESKGVANTRIQAEGIGSKQPIADNKEEKGRAKNNRIEIVLYE